MLYRAALLSIISIAAAAPAWAADNSTAKDSQPAPHKPAPLVTLALPAPDFSPPHRELVSPLDDIPASGSSSEYVHGPNEGPVPGANQYTLGGPPPNAQNLLGD